MLPLLSHGSGGRDQVGGSADRFTRAGVSAPGLFRQVDGGMLEPGVRRTDPHVTAPRRGKAQESRRMASG